MQLSLVSAAILGGTLVSTHVVPLDLGTHNLYERGDLALSKPSSHAPVLSFPYLEKRRGGGGGGGGSGGGGKGGGSGSSGSGSSGSSSSGSSSSGSSGGGRGSTSSSSSYPPTYGTGGRYYGGGSTSAYGAGTRSPGGIAPYLLGGAALGSGIWLYGAYGYNWHTPYRYRNCSSAASHQDETLPVECLCAQYAACGCDDNGDSTYLDSVFNDCSRPDTSSNSSLATIQTVNGSKTVVINGTLPNGTDDGSSSGAGMRKSPLQAAGYMFMVMSVVASVSLL